MTIAFHSQFALTPLSEEQRTEVRNLFSAFEKMRDAASEFKKILDRFPLNDTSSSGFRDLFHATEFITEYNPSKQIVLSNQFDATIESLYFTHRTAECLKAEGISFVGQLVRKSENQLLTISNLGRKSLNEIKEVLSARGLGLRMNVAGWKPPVE